ncbi:MAG: exodeoxyribonuclease VII large subunit [Butyrivibrio sp.]|nr:exodeoxyribonuclease VII large subunit [Butyrivibrio sp.]
MSIILNVPYAEKDRAKAAGARWNPNIKKWYCTELNDALRRWYEDGDDGSGGAGARAGAKRTAKKNSELSISDGFWDDGLPFGGGESIPASSSEDLAEDPRYRAYKTVTEVNALISDTVQSLPEFKNICVKGEITNFSGRNNGNYYFHIKDENALLPCVLWASVADYALHFEFESGKKVAIAGRLRIFEKQGKYNLEVREIEEMGAGEARLKYLQLKRKLEEEGLFDIAHKKPIPKFPKRVGIVTSKNGQARKDIEKVSRKRNPFVELILYHVNVQGQNAVRTIVEGIRALDTMGLDTIIVGRGGGSDEELIAYNDEAIARAVFAAATPIVSAVGHEGNWSLIDYVSDKRVATPTEAAEETIPDIMTTIQRIDQLKKSIDDNMKNNLRQKELLLQTKKARLDSFDPVRLLKERRERLSVLLERMRPQMDLVFDDRMNRFKILVTRLHGLSPTAKLVSGFGYITKDERPVVSVQDVNAGDRVDIRIHDGLLRTRVEDTAEDSQV